jgi:deoxyribodipyrimidine photo-lyase
MSTSPSLLIDPAAPPPDRAALANLLRAAFPDAANRDGAVSETRGGSAPSAERLEAIDAAAYAHSRNHLDGAVTRLSPYIRHGVIQLAHTRDAVLARADAGRAYKLICELGWRDYWQRVYAKIGDGVWRDREPYKTGFIADDYADDLPAAIPAATTGLACIDAFAAELTATGYLHNHARMYVAAYVVHWCRVKWQAGARWFLTHLLDGDPASNNLSWQWVTSTFAAKPYIFNRDNLVRHGGGQYCEQCSMRLQCPFDDDYDNLNARLFPHRDRAV